MKINSNINAHIAANALSKNQRVMGNAMERLSTGVRINSARGDAAGLAITSKMTSQINGLKQAVRNTFAEGSLCAEGFFPAEGSHCTMSLPSASAASARPPALVTAV